MDALYPRLLVTRFAECFGFYRAILPPLTGAALVKGTPDGPYANWDIADQTLLVLYDRSAMAAALGTTGLPVRPAAPAQDTAMLVFRVDDVDAALDLCLRHGGTLAAPAADRPEWGPNLRSAHLRDPDGHLVELQSY
ncbi:VOC family protein [Streptomyces sp. CBMA156]|uniref:VOC family protein n=1 Tax=Streptomyces sp. CBMA156 TaxID=1930280 RepID=UPI001661C38A|nr:VOC family protein [Streptomyces sp. CBMA156]MBD0674293.1 glyoxalase/bleomycin resistance/extradiol dioxygenase family protein [Streptomyces sp. CBMA156]